MLQLLQNTPVLHRSSRCLFELPATIGKKATTMSQASMMMLPANAFAPTAADDDGVIQDIDQLMDGVSSQVFFSLLAAALHL